MMPWIADCMFELCKVWKISSDELGMRWDEEGGFQHRSIAKHVHYFKCSERTFQAKLKSAVEAWMKKTLYYQLREMEFLNREIHYGE